MTIPTITLEDHFSSKALAQSPAQLHLSKHLPSAVSERLKDISADGIRLKEMDEANVTIQVISHSPGAASSPPEFCKAANDELAAAVQKAPERYKGFACLPMSRPKDAAKELERCVKDLGFVGALVDNHTSEGEYYDNSRFWCVFEEAEELDVPIYIHPTLPTEDVKNKLFRGNYSEKVAGILGMAGIGWHQDTALHVLRLFASGLFDKHPKLKIIIGHMGEMLPFQLERCDHISASGFDKKTENAKTLRQVWDENIWITTSGMFSTNPLACVLRNTNIDRIMYSIDWPFAQNESGWKFIQDCRESGLVSEEQLEMIAYKNAEKLLKIGVPGVIL